MLSSDTSLDSSEGPNLFNQLTGELASCAGAITATLETTEAPSTPLNLIPLQVLDQNRYEFNLDAYMREAREDVGNHGSATGSIVLHTALPFLPEGLLSNLVQGLEPACLTNNLLNFVRQSLLDLGFNKATAESFVGELQRDPTSCFKLIISHLSERGEYYTPLKLGAAFKDPAIIDRIVYSSMLTHTLSALDKSVSEASSSNSVALLDLTNVQPAPTYDSKRYDLILLPPLNKWMELW